MHGLLRNQLAYVLATAYHETAKTMKPVEEGFYLGDSSRVKSFQRTLRYYPFYGRGYAQLTWQENYAKGSKVVGVDLVKNPHRALEPEIAAKIIVHGMVEGWFTGKKLSDYITLQKSDFKEARRIVNGTDQANKIAGYAREYDKDLLREGYGVDQVIEVKASEAVPEPVVEKPVAKTTRFWTWLTAAAFPALGLLDWRVQLLSVAIVAGLAIWAIFSMPQVKDKIAKLVEAM